jgi:hypothetical protein
MKMTVFWNFVPFSLVEIYRRFTGACYLIDLIMEAVSTSETSVNIYQTTRRNIPEDSHSQFFLNSSVLLTGWKYSILKIFSRKYDKNFPVTRLGLWLMCVQ